MRKLILSLIILTSVVSLKAATITVLNTADSGTGSLRDAISLANSNDTIRFDSNLIANGSDSIVFLSDIVFSKSLVIKGLYNSTDTLLISGGLNNRIFKMTNSSLVHFDSLVLINSSGVGYGGAIWSDNVDSIYISNSVIRNNTSPEGGGAGLFAQTSNSGPWFTHNVVVINNCIFKNNTSFGSSFSNGGAVNLLAYDSYTHLLITNSEFHNNYTIANGGAISSYNNDGNTYLTINDSEIYNNNCDLDGGGIFLSSPDIADIESSINNTKIHHNTAQGNGGGIASSSYGSTKFTGNYTSIYNNSAIDGGGIYNYAFSVGSTTPVSRVTVNYSTINNNSASGNGGGIYSEGTSTSSIARSILNITKSTISNNSSTSDGGGIFSKSTAPWSNTYSTVNVNNATIANNSALNGGGIYSFSNSITNDYSSIKPKGSIIALNGTNNIHNSHVPTIDSDGYNIFEDSIINGSLPSDSLGQTVNTLNLGILQDNGGSTLTMVPGVNSVALNSGDPLDTSNAQNINIVGIRDRGAAEYTCNTSSNQFITSCNSFITASGQVITNTGIYFDTIPNSIGCDSIITYNIVIPVVSFDTISTTICEGDTFLFQNSSYFSSGYYSDTLQTTIGCDSIIKVLNLTVNQLTNIAIDTTVCEVYSSPLGNLITTSGTYYDTLLYTNSCDSIIYTINLTISHNSNSEIDTTVCNEYVGPNGTLYTSSGTYFNTIINNSGCDSVIQINLTVEDIDLTINQNFTELIAIQTGATYQWLDCDNGYTEISGATSQIFNATSNGNYACQISKNDCTDTTMCTQVNSVGLQDFSNPFIQVFPNPTSGFFQIDFGIEHVSSVRVYSLSGEVVYCNDSIGGSLLVIELDLESGIYLIESTTNYKLFSNKLIVTRL